MADDFDYAPVPGKFVRTDIIMRKKTYDALIARLDAAEKTLSLLAETGSHTLDDAWGEEIESLLRAMWIALKEKSDGKDS